MKPIKHRIFLRWAVFAAIWLPVVATGADIRINLDFRSGGIEGNSDILGCERCIDVSSAAFDVATGTSAATGSARDLQVTAPAFSDIRLTKWVDNASADLFQAAFELRPTSPVIIRYYAVLETAWVNYMEIELEDVLVSRFGSTADEGEGPMETLSLHYSGICLRSREFDKGAPGPWEVACYDIRQGRKK